MMVRPGPILPTFTSASPARYARTLPKRRTRSISVVSRTGNIWWRRVSMIDCGAAGMTSGLLARMSPIKRPLRPTAGRNETRGLFRSALQPLTARRESEIRTSLKASPGEELAGHSGCAYQLLPHSRSDITELLRPLAGVHLGRENVAL